MLETAHDGTRSVYTVLWTHERGKAGSDWVGILFATSASHTRFHGSIMKRSGADVDVVSCLRRLP